MKIISLKVKLLKFNLNLARPVQIIPTRERGILRRKPQGLSP